MRRLLALAACVAVFLSILPPAQAATLAQAWRLAALYVPASALPERMEDVPEGMAFYFEDQRKAHRYEVLLNPDGTALRRRELDAYKKKGADRVRLDTKAVLASLARPGKELVVEGMYTVRGDSGYELVLVYLDMAERLFYRDVLNAADGEPIFGLMKPLTAPGNGILGFEAILEAAQEYLPGGALLDFSLEQIGGGFLYMMTVFHDGSEHRLTLDAVSGEVIGDSEQFSALSVLTDGIQQTAGNQQVPPASQAPTAVPVPATQAPAASTQVPAAEPTVPATQPPTAQPTVPATPPPTATVVTASPAPSPSPTPEPDDDDDDEYDDDEFDDDEWDDDEWDDDELDDLWDDWDEWDD